jgi:hypothetical protein
MYKCRPIVAFDEEALTYECQAVVALWWEEALLMYECQAVVALW